MLCTSFILNKYYFLTNSIRVTNKDLLKQKLENKLKNFEGEEISNKLLQSGVPAGVIQNIHEYLQSEHARYRNIVINSGDFKTIASPIKFSNIKTLKINTEPPIYGKDNDEILLNLGFSDETIRKLKINEVVKDKL